MQNQDSKPVSQVINNFMTLTGCKELYLYGGAAIDRYLNPEVPIMDYDIAIKDFAEYHNVLKQLRENGFDVGTPRISHNLATVAKHPEHGVFDLSCMDIQKNGIFNLEKFYIEYNSEYPRGRAVDSFNAVSGLRDGRIEIANDPDKEHAYDLLRRFSVLAGKYGFSLKRGGINEDTMAIIESKLADMPLTSENEHHRTRCLSRFFGATFRKTNQVQYLHGMAKTGLLAYGFPSLNETLLKPEFIDDLQQKKAEDKFDLLKRLFKHAPDRDALFDEICLLKNRERDREDPRVFEFIESIESKKTSVHRLTSKIISPLLKYKQQYEGGL